MAVDLCYHSYIDVIKSYYISEKNIKLYLFFCVAWSCSNEPATHVHLNISITIFTQTAGILLYHMHVGSQ